ncbi:Peroxisomal membrane protein 2 [Seminavis robusta]|uniref:Peroxisomal membrane protein 2 n=1 Tax=Seminavis robusta TaxID=568900 RepID=A0A9N8DGC7_9STRA|nr:Peroxisomal membrane protein 2 [Seminavis robusta]|eukprot:Sro77_g042120.1 Peroxisomal membrane protein 2 (287) ;mRNA; f:73230-74090
MSPRPEEDVDYLGMSSSNDDNDNDEETGSFHGTQFQAIHFSIDENSPLLGLDKPAHSNPPQSAECSLLSGCQRAWQWYEAQLDQMPILTKSLTSAILTGAGDLAGQLIQELSIFSSSSTGSTSSGIWFVHLDLYRTSCFFLMGLLLQAPITHYYYVLLDAKLPPTPNPWTRTTFLKLAIDQLIWAPLFTLGVFFFLDTLQGQNAVQHIQHDFVMTMLANWKLWVPASLINMAFCPPQLRVLYCNCIFFVWSICLSILLNGDSSSPTATATTTITTTIEEAQERWTV